MAATPIVVMTAFSSISSMVNLPDSL